MQFQSRSERFSNVDFLCSSATDHDAPVTDEALGSRNDPIIYLTSSQVLPEQPERENQIEAESVNLNNSAVADSSSPFGTDQITIEVVEVVTLEIVRPYPKACPRKLIENSRKKGKIIQSPKIDSNRQESL